MISRRRKLNQIERYSDNNLDPGSFEHLVFGRKCTFQFGRLPLLGNFVNGLFLAALLMSAAIEGIQTCFHEGHSLGKITDSIFQRHQLVLPGFLVAFAVVGALMQWCTRFAHQFREHELHSEMSLLRLEIEQGVELQHSNCCLKFGKTRKQLEKRQLDPDQINANSGSSSSNNNSTNSGASDCSDSRTNTMSHFSRTNSDITSSNADNGQATSGTITTMEELNVDQLNFERSIAITTDNSNETKHDSSDKNSILNKGLPSLPGSRQKKFTVQNQSTTHKNYEGGCNSTQHHNHDNNNYHFDRINNNKIFNKKHASLDHLPYDCCGDETTNISLKSIKTMTTEFNNNNLRIPQQHQHSSPRGNQHLCVNIPIESNNNNNSVSSRKQNTRNFITTTKETTRSTKDKIIDNSSNSIDDYDYLFGDGRQQLRSLTSPVALLICAMIMYFIRDEMVTEISDASLAVSIVVISYITLYPLMKSSGLVLLQTAPLDVELDSVEKDLHSISPFIVDVKDLHIWRLTARSKLVATCRIVVKKVTSLENELPRIINDANLMFRKYGIQCTTIEPVIVSSTT